LRGALQHLPNGTLLDGELVAYRTSGIEPGLYLFDIIKSEGKLVTNLPLYQRRELLESIAPASTSIILAEQIKEGKREYYHRVISDLTLIEGIVLKNLNSTYPISE